MNIPDIKAFFDTATNTISYVVADSEAKLCAVIDSVLDYDSASGRTSTSSADILIDYIKVNELTVDWIIETHIHADHLTAAAYIKSQLGGRTAIGHTVKQVQKVFGEILTKTTDLILTVVNLIIFSRMEKYIGSGRFQRKSCTLPVTRQLA